MVEPVSVHILGLLPDTHQLFFFNSSFFAKKRNQELKIENQVVLEGFNRQK